MTRTIESCWRNFCFERSTSTIFDSNKMMQLAMHRKFNLKTTYIPEVAVFSGILVCVIYFFGITFCGAMLTQMPWPINQPSFYRCKISNREIRKKKWKKERSIVRILSFPFHSTSYKYMCAGKWLLVFSSTSTHCLFSEAKYWCCE